MKITVLPNGPYKVENVTSLVDGGGQSIDTQGKPDIYLCRCGHSEKKPFCDGGHNRKGFKG